MEPSLRHFVLFFLCCLVFLRLFWLIVVLKIYIIGSFARGWYPQEKFAYMDPASNPTCLSPSLTPPVHLAGKHVVFEDFEMMQGAAVRENMDRTPLTVGCLFTGGLSLEREWNGCNLAFACDNGFRGNPDPKFFGDFDRVNW